MRQVRPIGFRPDEISALVNRPVVEVHAGDAAFLWILRERAIAAPHYSLADLARLDSRIAAHLDGLLVAEESEPGIVASLLEAGGPGEIFAAAVVALERGDREALERVVSLAGNKRELLGALVAALAWEPFERSADALGRWSRSSDPAQRRVAIAAFAAHRRDPGAALDEASIDPDPELRGRALRALGELGRVSALERIVEAARDPDDHVRECALWSALRLGERDEALFRALRRSAANVRLEVRCRPREEARELSESLREDPRAARLAIAAAAALGDPRAIDWLLSRMADDAVARAAGEAFREITGADLARLDLERDAPEGFVSGPSDDPADPDVAIDDDEDLPWPDPARVAKWWAEESRRFAPGRRYLLGRDVDGEGLGEALRSGMQRQRAAAALELAIAAPESPLFEVRAPAVRQRAALGLPLR